MTTTTALPELLRAAEPVFVAPMAGGPSGARLVVAAAEAGHFAQLAAGYRTVEQVVEQVAAVRGAGVERFGVNLFVPSPAPVAPDVYSTYATAIRPTATRLGVDRLPDLREDDDAWPAKVDALLAVGVPAVSFTFGAPAADVVARFRAAGTVTLQTVTSVAEAAVAVERGIDLLVVQSAAAGGHSGVFDAASHPASVPLPDLVRAVVAATDRPVIATGGVGTASDVRSAVAAGASAVAVGTAVLRAPESDAAPVHKDALADASFVTTRLTRAFSGRPARALVNAFVTEFSDRAPVGYPAVHHLTKPIRAAATAAGDPSAVNLWAGTGWRHANDRPVAETLRHLGRLV